MGWLLRTGALPDAKSFYCPSASDVDVRYAGADWNYTASDKRIFNREFAGSPYAGYANGN